ncbi:MAG: DUF819 family protein [Verrucomicrobiae bacterium]|nr:DUF819 family protein [Verrucomicrobiae bacterium]
MSDPVFTNDASVFGLLTLVLAVIFVTSSSSHPVARRFYRFVPPLLLCYFVPALLHWPLGLISGEEAPLYRPLASRYLLPASLILLCISIDLKGLISLGPKSLVMFSAATLGIIAGGPVALLLVSAVAPDALGSDPANLWRGMSTLAGSWIGGGANQAAMKEIYQVSNEVFSGFLIVDVVVANIWMGCLLYGAGCSASIDRWLKADASAVDALTARAEAFHASTARIPTVTDYVVLAAVAFGGTGLAHWGADQLTPWFERWNAVTISVAHPEGSLVAWGLSSAMSGFFWLIVLATTVGLALSFTHLRNLESVGASRVGSIFIYILVATIGMQMDLQKVWSNLGLFAVGIVWMLVHISVLLIAAKIIRAPFFLVAVGSQANVGGAASAPVVASAFSPALAPVGALMAVLGYALGTYGAILCAELMRLVSAG